MALRYLIDGYNVLYAMDDMPPGSWQDKRAQLLAFLKARKPHGQNAITVVFDNREGGGSRTSDSDFTVVYTAGETADDWISSEVRKAPNPRTLVVVSNDQGIRVMVRGTGAKFVTATEFLKAASPKPTITARREKPLEEDTEITDEFKKKWL